MIIVNIEQGVYIKIMQRALGYLMKGPSKCIIVTDQKIPKQIDDMQNDIKVTIEEFLFCAPR